MRMQNLKKPSSLFLPFVFAVVFMMFFLVLLQVYFRFPLEDAYISFRYVRNILDGYGFVFNKGEYIEGYSNFLWIMLLTFSQWFARISIEMLSYFLSLLCFGVLMFLLSKFSFTKLKAPVASIAFALGVVFFHPFVLMWLSGGMETFLHALCYTLLVMCSVEVGTTKKQAFICALFSFLLLLSRLDALVIILALLVLFLKDKGLRWVSRYCMYLFLFILPYFSWKFYYFGGIIPNPFFLKVMTFGLFLNHVVTGIEYLASFYVHSGMILLLFPLLYRLLKNTKNISPIEKNIWRYHGLALAMYSFLVLVIGGDFYYGNRLLMPFLPISLFMGLLFLNNSLVSLCTRIHITRILTVCLSVCILFSPLSAVRQRSESKRYYFEAAEAAKYILPSEAVVAVAPIGIFGYNTPFTIIDTLGVVDPVIAHSTTKYAYAVGHEKGDGEYILSRNPDVIFLKNFQIQQYPLEYDTEEVSYISDKELMQSPVFASKYEVIDIEFAPDVVDLQKYMQNNESDKNTPTFFLRMYKKIGYSLKNVICEKQTCKAIK